MNTELLTQVETALGDSNIFPITQSLIFNVCDGTSIRVVNLDDDHVAIRVEKESIDLKWKIVDFDDILDFVNEVIQDESGLQAEKDRDYELEND